MFRRGYYMAPFPSARAASGRARHEATEPGHPGSTCVRPPASRRVAGGGGRPPLILGVARRGVPHDRARVADQLGSGMEPVGPIQVDTHDLIEALQLGRACFAVAARDPCQAVRSGLGIVRPSPLWAALACSGAT